MLIFRMALLITLIPGFVNIAISAVGSFSVNAAPVDRTVPDPERFASYASAIPPMMDSTGVSGLAIARLERGEMVWHLNFGVKNTDTNEPVDDKTVFEAASLSKPVFAYAVLKLVEAGQFELDTPLVQYAPLAYLEAQFLKKPVDDDRFNKITGRMVLSHTPGFPNWRQGDKGLTIENEPGGRFSYSGEGFVLLQRVIEHLTGESLDAFVRQRVFAPLDMTSSSYVWREDYATRKANGHSAFGQVREFRKPDEGNAAASLHTTIADYSKFVSAILSRQGLSASLFEQMLTPQIQMPRRWGDYTSLADSLYWGLGWGLQYNGGRLSFWHWGDNGAFKCYVVGYPVEQRGLIYFTNSENGLTMGRELTALVLGESQPALHWLNYGSYRSAGFIFARTAISQSVMAAREQWRARSHSAGQAEQLDEGAINRLGYHLLQQGRIEEAIEVFRLNIDNHPESWNVYDSYAEAQLRNGNRAIAAEYYQKSLDRNPDNRGAAQLLTQLRPGRAMTGNASFKLSGYATAHLVTLAGSFNDWNDLHTLFERDGDDWICKIELVPGKHLYKFVVDGKWITDPANDNTETDEAGHTNSVLLIRP